MSAAFDMSPHQLRGSATWPLALPMHDDHSFTFFASPPSFNLSIEKSKALYFFTVVRDVAINLKAELREISWRDRVSGAYNSSDYRKVTADAARKRTSTKEEFKGPDQRLRTGFHSPQRLRLDFL